MRKTYGPDAKPLLPLTAPDPNLTGDSGLMPIAGALGRIPEHSGGQTVPTEFHRDQRARPERGPLITRSAAGARRGSGQRFQFGPDHYFFYQDNRRCYYVETPKYYWTGSFLSPKVPSDPAQVPYEVLYRFHPFYHPFTRLLWNQLGAAASTCCTIRGCSKRRIRSTQLSRRFQLSNDYQPTSRVQWDLANAAHHARRRRSTRANGDYGGR